VELLRLMPAAAAANWDAALTMGGIKLEALAAEATWWQLELDDVREVPLIHVPSDLELAAGHVCMAAISSAHHQTQNTQKGWMVSQLDDIAEKTTAGVTSNPAARRWSVGHGAPLTPFASWQVDAIGKASADFKSLADPWADTTTPHGRLMVTCLAAWLSSSAR